MSKPIKAVNDFVVKFANVNGSGSASANELFARAILRMGVPVATRNIFPSNIQGLPTWYEVRVSGKGWIGRRGGVDLMVAMNPQTWDKDVTSIDAGGYLFYDSSKPMPESKFRPDIHVIGMPLTEICNRTYRDPRQRQLFKNIIYVGALSYLLDMELETVETLIQQQYASKQALLDSNIKAVRMGHDYARENLSGICALKVARADAVGNRIFVNGNDAAAPRLRLWRCHRRRLVSDHAVDVARRSVHEILPQAARRSRRPRRTTSPSCRPRTRSPPSAPSSAPAGTARAPSPPHRAPASR